MAELGELALGLLDGAGDLARLAKVLVGIELNAQLDGLAAEQVGVDVPVLGGLERALVEGLDETAMGDLGFGHDVLSDVMKGRERRRGMFVDRWKMDCLIFRIFGKCVTL